MNRSYDIKGFVRLTKACVCRGVGPEWPIANAKYHSTVRIPPCRAGVRGEKQLQGFGGTGGK